MQGPNHIHRRLLFVLMCLLLAAVPAVGADPDRRSEGEGAAMDGVQEAEGHTRPEIIVSDTLWPPYFFAETEGKPPGFARELLEICVERAGYSPRFEVIETVPEVLDRLEKGALDLHVISYRKEREEVMSFASEPLFVSAYRPFVRADSGIGIRSLEDFAGLTVGHIPGRRFSQQYLDMVNAGEIQVREIDQNLGLLRALLDGEIDVALVMVPSMLGTARSAGVGDQIRYIDFDLRTARYFTVVSNRSRNVVDRTEFLASIDRCLRDLRASGQYDRIGDRYVEY